MSYINLVCFYPTKMLGIKNSILGIHMAPGTEFSGIFCAGNGLLQLDIVHVWIFFLATFFLADTKKHNLLHIGFCFELQNQTLPIVPGTVYCTSTCFRLYLKTTPCCLGGCHSSVCMSVAGDQHYCEHRHRAVPGHWEQQEWRAGGGQ